MVVPSEDIQDWNRIADVYVQSIGETGDTTQEQFREVLWDALGDLKLAHVLDAGCGHGWLSNLMTIAGANVVGVDASESLLKRARDSYPSISFVQHDLSKGLPALNHTFRRIVANMVVHDLPDINNLFRDVRRMLQADGRFIFTLPHPCFFNKKSDRDAKTGQLFRKIDAYLPMTVYRIESFGGHNVYHRPLTYYFDVLRENQMAVTHLFEPKHIPNLASDAPDYEFHRGIPVFVFIEAMPY